MKKLLALTVALISTATLACESIVSPPWYLIDDLGKPVSILVFERSGHKELDLTFEIKEKQRIFTLQPPKNGYRWVYGTCALKMKQDQSIFALVKAPKESGWSPEIQNAYRINIKKGTLEAIATNELFCYASAIGL